jgi:hypothetical protein
MSDHATNRRPAFATAATFPPWLAVLPRHSGRPRGNEHQVQRVAAENSVMSEACRLVSDSVCPGGIDMSMISSVSNGVSAYQAPVSAAVRGAALALPPKEVAREHEQRPRETTLVSAMMAALQALGLGQPAAASTAPAADVPPVTPAATAVATTPAPVAADPVTDADTIHKAVQAFAHALFGALHQLGHGEHTRQGEGEDHGDHSGGNMSRSARGYDGFVQRLERLAASMGAAPAAPSASATPAPDAAPVPAVAASPTTANNESTPGAVVDVGTSVHGRGTSRLLTAFGKLVNLLQPPSSSAPADPAAPAAPASASISMADKLKLFLQTLAQSMHTASAAPPASATGSLLDVRA